MPQDYRPSQSAAHFDAIGVDEDYPIDRYYDSLIAENPNLHDLGETYPRGYGDIRLIPQLTKGQQFLILLGTFDGQVKNGGITQFFWNYPEYIFEVRDAIEYVGPADLLRHYEQALEHLVGKKDSWLKLRDECYKGKESPD